MTPTVAAESSALEALHSAIESLRAGELEEWELQLVATRMRNEKTITPHNIFGALNFLNQSSKLARGSYEYQRGYLDCLAEAKKVLTIILEWCKK